MSAVLGVSSPLIHQIPDGLELDMDPHCFVIAGEWTVVITIDEPRPPPELEQFAGSLQQVITRNSLLLQHAPGWLARLKWIRRTVKNPEPWWRTAQFPTQDNHRTRRGLFDAVGHLSKFLFGTATDAEVRDLKRAVRTLQDNQGRMITMLDEFTTVVNHTYDEIQANRNQLNRMASNMHSLTTRLNSELSLLHQRLRVLRRRLDIELLLQQLEVITRTYVRSHEAFLHRKENLETGRLTENILPPEILQAILDSSDDSHARGVTPLQWYYEHTAAIPIWFDQRLIYRARLPLVEPLEWHHITLHRWPVPMGDWQAAILLPERVLKDTQSGVLDVSPDCYGHRPRVCRRGLISRPTAHSCLTRLLAAQAAYHTNCTFVFERRLPMDVVYPKAPNAYVLITSGTVLTYRCEGQPENSWPVAAGVYKLHIQSPCTLYGGDWHLRATFHRTINVSLQTPQVDFQLNTTLTDLLTNLSSFRPLINELELLGDVDRKQFTIGDMQTLPRRGRSAPSDPVWHSFWTIPVLAVGAGVAVLLWRRLHRSPTTLSDQNLEIELKPVTHAAPPEKASTAPFDFGNATLIAP